MKNVDSYCEAILAEGQFSLKEPEDAFPRKQFLIDLKEELDVLSLKTAYTADDVQSGKTLLYIVKSIFGSKRFLVGAKLNDNLQQYYNETMHIVDAQIKQDSIDTDAEFGVISNLMLITCNICEWKKVKKRRDSAAFQLVKRDPAEVYKYINQQFGIENKKKRIEKIASVQQNRCRKKMPKVIRKIATIVFAVGAVLLMAISLIGKNDVETNQVRPEATNIFTTITNWWEYDLKKKPLPVVSADGSLKRAMPYTMAGSFLCIGALVFLWLVPPLHRYVTEKLNHLITIKKDKMDCRWYELRYLYKAMIATEVRLKELGD